MNQRVGLLLLTAALGAAIGFGSFQAWRRVASPPAPVTATAPAPVAATTDVAAALDAAEPAPANTVIPDRLPALSLPDLQGRLHALDGYSGQPTLFNFWATWCAPCLREIPLLNRLTRSPGADGSKPPRIVGIASDLRSNVVDFLKKNRIDYDLLVGERGASDAAARLGVPLILPFTVFVASDGRVVAIKLGELHWDDATAILDAIHELDLGQRSLAATRTTIETRLRELAGARARLAAEGKK